MDLEKQAVLLDWSTVSDCIKLAKPVLAFLSACSYKVALLIRWTVMKVFQQVMNDFLTIWLPKRYNVLLQRIVVPSIFTSFHVILQEILTILVSVRVSEEITVIAQVTTGQTIVRYLRRLCELDGVGLKADQVFYQIKGDGKRINQIPIAFSGWLVLWRRGFARRQPSDNHGWTNSGLADGS